MMLHRNNKLPLSTTTFGTTSWALTITKVSLLALYLITSFFLMQNDVLFGTREIGEERRTLFATKASGTKIKDSATVGGGADDAFGREDECKSIEAEYRMLAATTVASSVSSESASATSPSFSFDRAQAEAYLQTHGPESIRRVITAYLEAPLNDTVPGTGSRGDLKIDRDHGTVPQFILPLPIRTQTPNDLKVYQYPRVQTCHDMPGKFPVDRGLKSDANGNAIVWNVGDDPVPDDFPQQEAPYCPVELDPFLPWIHDVFPSQDGTRIEFVAQNRRRCRTGTKFTNEVNRLAPQVALMQAISVERLDESKARALAPELWYNSDDAEGETTTPRYRLAPFNESSPDGMYTRFICRFHAVSFSSSLQQPQSIVIGETLSQFPFNYDLVSYRKGEPTRTLITPKGKDNHMFWGSTIRFFCPVPSDDTLRGHVATGNMVLSDGSPTLFVDVIPIRTSVRYAELHVTDDVAGPPEIRGGLPTFDPNKRWGPKNVLPRVEASGRWTNIPICSPPKFRDDTCNKDVLLPRITDRSTKPHVLSACLWAAAEYKSRGLVKSGSTDTQKRLEEWIEFHLLVGFDHIYLYDNSGAHSTSASLANVVDKYPGKITRIDWPSIVCNNNHPADDSTGERSSQYAAENSCRTRYGPVTEWIAAFDTDEYLVPMGNYTDLKQLLADLSKQGTNILSFRSSRGRIRVDKTNKVGNGREQKETATYLETYNCDSTGYPKPRWAERAKKQIYRTDYVPYHFVHYSTVTKGIMETYGEKAAKNDGSSWQRVYGESFPSERITDEVNEAVLLHAKDLSVEMTRLYETRCRHDHKKKWQRCWVAFPFPSNTSTANPPSVAYNSDGMTYNCFINEQIDSYWVPKLRDAMLKRRQHWAKNNII